MAEKRARAKIGPNKLRITMLVDDEYFYSGDPEYLGLTKLSRQQTEFFVAQSLRQNGHTVLVLPFREPVMDFTARLLESKPNLVFNLVQHFRHERNGEAYVASLLDLLRLKYTGCDPIASVLTTNKALCKDILRSNHINVPCYFEITKEKAIPVNPIFPLIVKPNHEGGSEGIFFRNLVYTLEQLHRISTRMLNKYDSLIAESFIRGKEITVGLVGNGTDIHVFPPRELIFPKKNKKDWFLALKVKEQEAYRKKMHIYSQDLCCNKSVQNEIKNISQKVFTVLKLRDYARIDFRVTPECGIYVIDVNVNPTLKPSTHSFFKPWNGISFSNVIRKITNTALKRYESKS